MKFFYLASVPDFEGRFLVHEKDCPLIPDSMDRDYLGPFNSGREALRKAKNVKASATCCKSCCSERLIVDLPVFNDNFVGSRE